VFPTVVTLEALDDDTWELLWEKAADRPAGAGMLEADEPPREPLEAAEDARTRLLPDHGDLGADCDCGTPGHPCPHATALCYQMAWLLLLARGRSSDRARDELGTAVLAAMTGPPTTDTDDGNESGKPGTGPADRRRAYEAREYESNRAACTRPAVPLPALPPPPGPPPAVAGPVTGAGAEPLDRLAADAAARARELLAYLLGTGPGPGPPPGGRPGPGRSRAGGRS
jgi:uncharacterized Zn finger protein